MVNLVRISVDWLKMAWATQPVLVVSCVMGVLGETTRYSWLVRGYGHHGAHYLEILPPYIYLAFQVLSLWYLALAQRRDNWRDGSGRPTTIEVSGNPLKQPSSQK